MKKFTKALCLVLALLMTMSVLSACGSGGSGKAGEDTTFSWWIYSGADSSCYMDYSENPAIRYTQQKQYGPNNKSIAFEFWTPPAGTSADNYSAMIASGDLADIIDALLRKSTGIGACKRGTPVPCPVCFNSRGGVLSGNYG